jgi:hypothetical protein
MVFAVPKILHQLRDTALESLSKILLSPLKKAENGRA